MSMKLRHVGIVVSNLPKMIHFYTEVLGLPQPQIQIETGPYIDNIFHKDNVIIKTIKFIEAGIELIVIERPFKPVKWIATELHDVAITHYSLTVQYLENIREKLKINNVDIHCDIQTSPNGKVKNMFIKDPDGNILELVEEIQ